MTATQGGVYWVNTGSVKRRSHTLDRARFAGGGGPAGRVGLLLHADASACLLALATALELADDIPFVIPPQTREPVATY